MDKKKLLYTLAGLAGVAAWLLFILACTGWPAWSPDSSKVLFPYSDPDSKDGGIALYDRTAGSVTSIFNYHLTGPSGMIPYAQFTRDGKQALVAMEWDHDRPPELLLLPMGGQAPARQFALPETKQISLAPYPEIGGDLYMGFDYIARLDLKSGEVTTKKLSEGSGIHLIPAGDRIWFMVYDIERQGREGKGMKFGELDRGDLGLKPFFEFWESDEQKLGITDFNAYSLTVEPGGARLLTSAHVEGKPALLLFGKSGLEQIIKPEFPVEGCQVASVAWSADRKTIYAATLVPAKENGRQDVAIAEIPVGGGPVRLVPMLHLARARDRENSPEIYLRVSLAPNGRALAVTTGFLPRDWIINKEDRALYLMDLTDPARKMTRFPIPTPPAAARE